MVYAEQGKDVLAKNYISQSIKMLEELKDYYAISDYLTYMSDIYLKQNDWTTALNYAQRSLEPAQRYGLKDQISTSNLKLSELYQKPVILLNPLNIIKIISFIGIALLISSVQQMADLERIMKFHKNSLKSIY
jgi:hypothetical protein